MTRLEIELLTRSQKRPRETVLNTFKIVNIYVRLIFFSSQISTDKKIQARILLMIIRNFKWSVDLENL